MSERKGQLRVVPVPSYHDMGPAERNELFVVAAVLLRTDVMDEVSGVLTSDMFLDPNLALAFRPSNRCMPGGCWWICRRWIRRCIAWMRCMRLASRGFPV